MLSLILGPNFIFVTGLVKSIPAVARLQGDRSESRDFGEFPEVTWMLGGRVG